jgi:uncharacterized protein (TIGR03435 family)
MPRLAAFLVALVLVEGLLDAQHRIALVDEATLPRFEVVSVRPGDPRGGPPRVDFPPGRFVQENAPLMNAISVAFDALPNQFVEPLPDLVTREPFTIDARMPAGTSATNLKLMMRAMLADRFKLKVHVVSAEHDAYALTLASRDGKLGPQLRPASFNCVARMEAVRRNESVTPLPDGAKPCFNVGPGRLDLTGMPLSTLVQMISNQVGRPVEDQTGLTGTFDVEMRWSPAASGLLPPGTDVAPAGDTGPSVFTAVQEQLGFRLQPAKMSIDHLVIDHIERPEPN